MYKHDKKKLESGRCSVHGCKGKLMKSEYKRVATCSNCELYIAYSDIPIEVIEKL